MKSPPPDVGTVSANLNVRTGPCTLHQQGGLKKDMKNKWVKEKNI